jgi:RND family efflux transporter MFP subunit
VALIQARSQYELSQKHLAALQTGGKEQALKGAKGQLVSAEGKYRGAAAQLAYSEIHSPIDGVVTDRPLYAGETPAAGTPLLTVMDTATVIARAHIPQDEAVLLKPGDAASVTGPGDVAASGKVMLVSPALDPNSTTVEVWIEIPNSDGRLRPGSTVRVNVVAETARNALVIPAPALLKTPEGKISVVVVDRASMAGLTPVEVGIRNGECVQITKGLTAGDTVIVSGGYGLPDRTKENPSPAPGAEVASTAGGNEP